MTACPTCHKKGDWKNESSGPFCSERCKVIDLGKWLGEEYRISSPLTPEFFEELMAAEDKTPPESDD